MEVNSTIYTSGMWKKVLTHWNSEHCFQYQEISIKKVYVQKSWYWPVIRSHTSILPSSRPLRTQPSFDDISNDTVFTAGFHFLNSVPDWRSYTTMKLGLGSSTSC